MGERATRAGIVASACLLLTLGSSAASGQPETAETIAVELDDSVRLIEELPEVDLSQGDPAQDETVGDLDIDSDAGLVGEADADLDFDGAKGVGGGPYPTGTSSDLMQLDPLIGVPAAPDDVGPPALDPQGDPHSSLFIGPGLMHSFDLLGEQVAPGTVARLQWNASQSFAGGDVVSPVVVLHGVRPGAVLCLTAAIHGDELNGVEIVRRLTRTIDPLALSGTVIAVPIVNLFGFSRNSRYLPDRRDLNRFFPGSPAGSIASRIAYSFFTQVVENRCEALVDIHTGSFDRSNLPQVRADLRLPEVLRFARGFGAVPVLHSAGSRGMLRVAATQVNIPAVTFEVGAPATLQPQEIEAGVRAIDALMHYLGMTAEVPGKQDPQAIFYHSAWVRADAGGLLISSVALGQRVVPNQRLGIVVDPLNDIEREIVSPLFGRVIGMARNQVVLPGFAAFHVGEETSEDRAVSDAAAGLVEDAVEEDHDAHGDRNEADRGSDEREPLHD